MNPSDAVQILTDGLSDNDTEKLRELVGSLPATEAARAVSPAFSSIGRRAWNLGGVHDPRVRRART